jgi:Acyl-coenzyme A:6-aminopenicillanic acid acyl-transferase
MPDFPARARERRILRDVRRHFPQQAEQLEGLARGAGVRLRRLSRATFAALADSGRGSSAALVREGAAWLARSLPKAAVLRCSKPDGRYRTLEITLPALTHPLLGVNEAGLAVACHAVAIRPGRCAAPAALLARDCLERFARVDSALAWCRERPGAPHAALLLADASGAAVGIEIAERVRDVRRPTEGLLVTGHSPRTYAQLAVQLAAAARDADAVAGALAAAFEPRGSAFALADPAGCRLWLPGAGWLAL